MEFRCRLGTATGEIVENVYVADSEARLKHDLEEKGMYVLAIERRGGMSLPNLSLTRRRIGTREFLIFNQELATLLKAGMPLVQSLNLLRERVVNPVFRSVLDDVHERIKAGASLSDAFGEHGDLFPGIYTASLLAGEKSGGLEEVLRRYVSYVKIVSEVKRKTLSALVYPIILVALAFLVVSIIVLRVVPEFADFYAGFGAELPWATQLIIAVFAVLTEYFWPLLFLLAGLVTAGWVWVRRPGQRTYLDRLLLAVPGIGQVARKFTTSQMARTLATLLGGGIPLVNALETATRSMSNRFMAQQLEEVSHRVREGESLAVSMTARGVFPDVAVKMVEVGESTGALQDMLNSVADFYDEEIETTLGRFVTLVEPVLLVVMGVVIAGLLLALYMPLFQLSSVLG